MPHRELIVITCGLALLAARLGASEPVRLTSDGHLKQRPAWFPDNRQLVFARHEGSTIFLYVLDTETGEERRLTSRSDPEFDAVPAPDGKALLLSINNVSPNQGDIDIHRLMVDAAETEPVAVTGAALSHEEWAAWSPGGARIAYTSTRDGNVEIYCADPDGGNVVRLTNDPAIDAHPCWTPDGAAIAFSTNRWGDLEIALIAPDGSGLRRFTDSRGLDDYPAFSPDGRWLAFTTNRSGQLDIAVADVATGEIAWSTGDEAIDNFPSWAPDGRLTFVSSRDGGFDIYVLHVPLPAPQPRAER